VAAVEINSTGALRAMYPWRIPARPAGAVPQQAAEGFVDQAGRAAGALMRSAHFGEVRA